MIFDLKYYFPKHITPRQIQLDTIQQIQDKLKSYNKIIICAPTGVGKSAIAVTIANAMKRSFILTSSKQLQDQYIADFGNIPSVKGKSNYPCTKQIEEYHHKIDENKAMKLELTCEKGKCVSYKSGTSIKTTCKYKDDIELYSKKTCPYYQSKYDGLTKKTSIWNYAMFFQTMTEPSYTTYKQYLDRDCIIFDEAHTLEDQLVSFIGININKQEIKSCKIKLGKTVSIPSVKKILEKMIKYYQKLLDNDKNINIQYYESRIRDIKQVIKNITYNKDNFLVDNSQDVISIKPIYISNYFTNMIKSKYQIFMSGTIDKDMFCNSIGLSKDDVGYIDVPKSPFPIQNRSITRNYIGHLGYKADNNTKKSIYKKINEIMKYHSKDRGIILCSSVQWCNDIIQGVNKGNKSRLNIYHSMVNGKTRKEILDDHYNSKNGVIISPSLWEGIDLSGDLSRFQIIVNVPYLYLGDKRVKTKFDRSKKWYNYNTMIKLLQGMGRSIRSEDDYAKTYILDSRFDRLLQTTKSSVPKSYHDMLFL